MINNVVITGRLTKDPELKTTQNGKSVTSFTVANETGYGDYKKTNFLNIVAWGKTAEFVASYFKKGSAIGICGTVQTRDYEKDGHKVYVTEIFANEVHFIESKKNDTADKTEADIFDNFPTVNPDEDDLPFI